MEKAQVFIAFDIGSYERLGNLLPGLDRPGLIKISIDHHLGEKEQFDLTMDDPRASSTGVLAFDLLYNFDPGFELTKELANPLYAAIMSDTGNFRFNNTDQETLQMASILIGVGVRPYEMFVEIYENLNTPGRMVVMRYLLDNLEFALDGRLAWSRIQFDELASQGAQPDDLHGLSDFLRSILGVEIGFVLVKLNGDLVDVSLRSKGHFPVNGVAAQFGGGGHSFAAGCRIPGTLDEASEQLTAALSKVIENG